jgi:hypothetical protein
VDLLFLASGLSYGVHKVQESVVRGNLKTAAIPVLTLSTASRKR